MRNRLLLAAILASALPAAAQLSETGGFADAIDVRVVNVEAVVTDRQGERVPGLSREDFRLLVDGQEVPVTFFNEVADGVMTAAAAVEDGEGGQGPAEEAVGRNILIFVDDSFGIAPHRNLVLDRIGKSLSHLSPADRVALVAFDGQKLDLLTGWTGDGGEIADALARARGRRAHGLLVRAQLRNLNHSLGAATSIQGFNTLPAQTTGGDDAGRFGSADWISGFESYGNGPALDLSSLLNRVVSASAAAMRALPSPQGRKAMLILSGGWPSVERISAHSLLASRPQWMDWMDSGAGRAGEMVFRPLVDTANLLGYTLYPVDMPGLGAGTGADVEDVDFAGGSLISSPWDQATDYALNHLARETGGKAAVNSARLEALDRLAVDTSSYYWLGFTPAWMADDRHHRIELEVRRPGMRVRTRSGFTDFSSRTEMAMSTESLLLFGEGQSELTDRMRVEMGKPQRAGLSEVKVKATLTIPADALTVVPVDGGFAAEANLSVGALDRWGGRSDLPVAKLRLNFPEEPKPGDMVRYRTMLRLSRGRQQVVFTVRDALTGEMVSARLEDYKP